MKIIVHHWTLDIGHWTLDIGENSQRPKDGNPWGTKKQMTNDQVNIGVMLNNLERDRLLAWQVAVHEGFRVVHTNALLESWLNGPQRQEYVTAARASGLTIATMFIGFDGQAYTDIDTIARTVGILPIPHLRRHRIDIAKQYSDLARELGVPALALHLGFMPAESSHPDYRFLVDAVQEIADCCAAAKQSLHLETGQESATDLLHFIEAVNRPNLGVNFDCGNFLLYGTDEPLHALHILSAHIRGVHCKDGFRPTEPGKLGKEMPLGQGAVDFPRFLSELKRHGYAGPLIIEREGGANAIPEIREGRAYLERLWKTESRE